MMRCGTAQYSVVQYDEVWYSIVYCIMMRCGTAQYSVVHCDEVWYSTVQYNAV